MSTPQFLLTPDFHLPGGPTPQLKLHPFCAGTRVAIKDDCKHQYLDVYGKPQADPFWYRETGVVINLVPPYIAAVRFCSDIGVRHVAISCLKVAHEQIGEWFTGLKGEEDPIVEKYWKLNKKSQRTT